MRADDELPMFPLGTVLFPHMVLPLQLFEPRYLAMIREVLAGDRRFGVTLIERGHEVGGGDVRTDLGTVARVLQAEEQADGRWLVVAIGTNRLRVREWLPDDPYPRARVAELAEPPPGPDAEALRVAVGARLRRVLALQTELGDPAVPATFELAEDPVLASYQAAVLAPLSPLDAQTVLAAADADGRLAALDRELTGIEELLRFRIVGHEEDVDGSR